MEEQNSTPKQGRKPRSWTSNTLQRPRVSYTHWSWPGELFRLWVSTWKNPSASPGDKGRKPKSNEKMPSDCFQVQTSKYFTLFFGNVDDRERTERRFNWMVGIVELQRVRYNWVTEHTHTQASCPTQREKTQGRKEQGICVGAGNIRSTRQEGAWLRGEEPAMRACPGITSLAPGTQMSLAKKITVPIMTRINHTHNRKIQKVLFFF